jgi:hypothetical protein
MTPSHKKRSSPDVFTQLLCGACGYLMESSESGVAYCDNENCQERGKLLSFSTTVNPIPDSASALIQ